MVKKSESVSTRVQTGRLPEIRARPFDRVIDRPSRIENLLSKQEQTELRGIATVLEYRRSGITVISAGEDAHFVYAIDSGVVRISRNAENGGRQILAIMLSGDLFGIPDGGTYVNSAETVSPSIIYRFPWERLKELMLRNPQLQLNVLMRVAHDLRQSQRQLMILGQQSIHQRLASFMLELVSHVDFYDEKRSVLALPLSRFDLADHLGTTPESIARALAKLETAGLIKRLSTRNIKVLKLSALRELHREPRRHD